MALESSSFPRIYDHHINLHHFFFLRSFTSKGLYIRPSPFMFERGSFKGYSLWVELSGDCDLSKPKDVVLFMELA